MNAKITIVFLAAFLAQAQATIPWDNTTALYRQLFNINYTLTDSIIDYQANMSLNTSNIYNSSLSVCNFIVAWHPANADTPIWLPSYVAPDTCNNQGNWNTTVYAKIPALDNTNGTMAVYFGLPFDGSLTYANNSGNDTFLFYDNGTLQPGVLIQSVNASSGTLYPGRWNITNNGGATSNTTYQNGEIVLNKSGLTGRNHLSTNQIFTDDSKIEFKWRATGTCIGQTLDGEFNVGLFWGGTYFLGGAGVDGPFNVWTYAVGPGDGTSPDFFGNSIQYVKNGIDNWSTVTVTNQWINHTGQWFQPVRIDFTGGWNYMHYAFQATNATVAAGGFNGTDFSDINVNNYKIGSNPGDNTTIIFPAWNEGALPRTSGRIYFDTRETCGADTQQFNIDDIRVSKVHPNMSISIPVGMSLEGTPAGPATPTPTPGISNSGFHNFQDLWNNGLAALFGSNILLVGGFFALFGFYILGLLGVGMEVGMPFMFGLAFILVIMNPGLLPGWAWTALLVIAGIIIARAVAKHSGY